MGEAGGGGQWSCRHGSGIQRNARHSREIIGRSRLRTRCTQADIGIGNMKQRMLRSLAQASQKEQPGNV